MQQQHGIALAPYKDLLGVHPTDIVPDLPPLVYDWCDEAQATPTWHWAQSYRNDEVYKQVFEGSYRYWYKNGPNHIPMLSGPGFFVRGFNPNPPHAEWHDNGIITDYIKYRTSLFDAHMDLMNDNLHHTLVNWWNHLDRVASWLRILDDIITTPIAMIDDHVAD